MLDVPIILITHCFIKTLVLNSENELKCCDDFTIINTSIYIYKVLYVKLLYNVRYRI